MARHIDKFTIEKIMAATNIVDVIGDFFDLQKRGVEYRCLCPFHEDKTLGNFSINPNKGIYKCFSCGAGGNAVDFLMNYHGTRLTYPDALRYLAGKYSIPIPEDDDDQQRWAHVKPAQPRKIQEVRKQMLIMPREIVMLTMGSMPQAVTDEQRQWLMPLLAMVQQPNVFIDWLTSLPWSNHPANNQRKRLPQTLWRYCVGRWADRVVFWQIDMMGRPRGGKLMRYLPDGHRDKQQNPGWLHNQDGIRQRLDLANYEYHSTLFGAHLIPQHPAATVNIVESEKTALIMANAQGTPDTELWVACGGIKFMKPEVVAWLIQHGRKVMLWPDRDGQQEWRDKIKHIDGAERLITTAFIERNWTEADGPKADVADIMLRHMLHPETYTDRNTTPHGRPLPRRHPLNTEQSSPDGVTEAEWQEHLAIMRDLEEYNRTHPDDEGFFEPDDVKQHAGKTQHIADIIKGNPYVQKLINKLNLEIINEE